MYGSRDLCMKKRFHIHRKGVESKTQEQIILLLFKITSV